MKCSTVCFSVLVPVPVFVSASAPASASSVCLAFVCVVVLYFTVLGCYTYIRTILHSTLLSVCLAFTYTVLLSARYQGDENTTQGYTLYIPYLHASPRSASIHTTTPTPPHPRHTQQNATPPRHSQHPRRKTRPNPLHRLLHAHNLRRRPHNRRLHNLEAKARPQAWQGAGRDARVDVEYCGWEGAWWREGALCEVGG
ncbi:hypothetical protein P153DRAFT_141831 [Dothidotthia symphoricarpi CBS 119687]|uniref:Uncharacterized protein n=1 Tax=Dothidotthia symphoricarpi CBS 119687 TaxID=1392245 RepID=A0A6A5ZWJ7_9PLEO|nr:uncharacterized protein P153DRAFT_141831 [Dothidotthia symphoricarpi CBS 119687]KAF2123960.1 hypothetical protein P153DRAFT_141831 [Dothidotthia symphoricarpi CBS 119687]